ncbi:hypothetical protein ACWODU_13170 [Enterococcus durans]|nr:hypothetical protein [Enterococcus durans]
MNDAAVWVPVPAMFYWGWLVPLVLLQSLKIKYKVYNPSCS